VLYARGNGWAKKWNFALYMAKKFAQLCPNPIIEASQKSLMYMNAFFAIHRTLILITNLKALFTC
jgi:hypothetical protein